MSHLGGGVILTVKARLADSICNASPLVDPTLTHTLQMDHPYIMYAKGLGGWVPGWVQKMAIFADIKCCIYAAIVGGWERKNTKLN